MNIDGILRNFYRFILKNALPSDYLWVNIHAWVKNTLRFCPAASCRVTIKDQALIDGKWGRFYPQFSSIDIAQQVTNNEPLYLFILAHEYMHYIHFASVGKQKFEQTPSILTEGFADYASRLFFRDCNYKLPDNERRIWGINYEYGRQLVQQLCAYESGISGFFSNYLNRDHANSPWHELNDLFL